ncbi:hypothetical protein GCM10009801_36670 [Streptomyces albiaxialis]|uniref:Uncharacterized protein n=1 Tax=Streptomyces albiaxialis TaxID=329523 RepID=A0ABN2W038_9ACTN
MRSHLPLRVGVPVAAVALWQAAALLRDSVCFPPPARILGHAHRLWFDGPASRLFLTDDAVANLPPSVGRVLAGFGTAAVCGIVPGLLLGALGHLLNSLLLAVERLVDPFAHRGGDADGTHRP